MVWKYEPMGSPEAYISKDNADRIISMCRSQRDILLFHLLSRTGRRITEVLRIRPCDIMWDNKEIKWNILKKRKEVKVSLPQNTQTMKLLREYIIYHPEIDNIDYIFKSNSKDGHLTSRRVRYLLISYGKALGIEVLGNENIHPHMFRHGFAIHFVKNMKRPDQIFHLQKILQHSDIRETMWYVDHFGKGEIREAMETMWSD